ncbi:pyridoxal-phosphate-dependent aminotransferase family protein [Candidatus Poribacteria bacterium]
MKKRLMTPGPVMVPSDALLAMAQPMIHHRTEEFGKVLIEATDALKYVFQTKNDLLIFTASSTGAMQSAVVNLLSPGDCALVIVGGKFGERWAEICEAYDVKVERLDVEWGMSVDPESVAEKLRSNPDIKCVYATLCETSTGVAHDIEGLARIVKDTQDALLVVDAVSGLGAMDIQTDNWGIDVVVSGSQKGLMSPPGLGFISINEQAWAAVEKARLPRYYFDLKKAKESLAKKQTPFTCSVSLILALRESLAHIKREGLANTLGRHARLAEATRAGVKALGLELFASAPANAVTAVKVPDVVDGKQLIKIVDDKYGITFAGGHGDLAGKIIRIAHLGYCDNMDIVGAISALEMALPELGYAAPYGVGVRAAEEVLQKT